MSWGSVNVGIVVLRMSHTARMPVTRSGNRQWKETPGKQLWDFRGHGSWKLADTRHAVCLVQLESFRCIDPFSHHHQTRVRQREVRSLAQSRTQPVRGQAGSSPGRLAPEPASGPSIHTASQDSKAISQGLQVTTTLPGQFKEGTAIESLIFHGLQFSMFVYRWPSSSQVNCQLLDSNSHYT